MSEQGLFLLGVFSLCILIVFTFEMIDRINRKKYITNVNALTKEDFNIKVSKTTITRNSEELISEVRNVKSLQNKEYFTITLDVFVPTETEDGYRKINDKRYYKNPIIVSTNNYHLYKEYILGYDCVELDAYKITLTLSDETRLKCRYKMNINYKFYALRAIIPHICECDAFSDEDIDDIVEQIKEYLRRNI